MPQSAVNCSTLCEQTAGSQPSTSQVSLVAIMHFSEQLHMPSYCRLGDATSGWCRNGTQMMEQQHIHTWATGCQALHTSACRTTTHTTIYSQLDIAVRKNWESHIDASHSRQPLLVKGERLVRYEVNAVIPELLSPCV